MPLKSITQNNIDNSIKQRYVDVEKVDIITFKYLTQI